MKFDIIVAIGENGLIGVNNKLPWNSKIDLKYFQKKTSETDLPHQTNVVIMGRKTYESIGKPLPNRINCVISRNKTKIENVYISSNLDDVIEMYWKHDNVDNIYVIGGAQIYELALQSPHLRYLYVTHVKSEYVPNLLAKTMFPFKMEEFVKRFPLINKIKDKNSSLIFCKYVNPFYNFNTHNRIHLQCNQVNMEEYQYLKL